MARTRTLSQIRDAARAVADQVSSTFVTNAQANFKINQSLNALWEMLVNADPNRYVTESTVNAVTGTKTYALPADFYKLRYVDKVDGDRRITIHEYHLSEKNRYGWQADLGDLDLVRYALIGSNLAFEPDPGTATYKLGYVQLFTELSADGDTFDGVAGWEDYVIWDTAAFMAIKEESDPTPYVMERQRIVDRIRAMARDRDASRAPQIADTRSSRDRSWRRRLYA